MNKKTKLRYRAVLSLILSAVLFCMPAMAFSMNGNNAIDVRAEDSGGKQHRGRNREQYRGKHYRGKQHRAGNRGQHRGNYRGADRKRHRKRYRGRNRIGK